MVMQSQCCAAGRRRSTQLEVYGARSCLAALTWALLAAYGRNAAAQAKRPQIVRWAIEATVTDIEDPHEIFPEVRLGDPVRGTLTYDVNTFTYPIWLNVVTMTIENPRTGEDLQFVKDVDGFFSDVFYFDAYPDETEHDDDLEIYQAVVSPAGFEAEIPIVTAFFLGPPDVLQGENPLANLTLDDWPIALLEFYDLADFEYTTYIGAEIGSLTLIETPLAAADFDYDGDVDGDDLYGWAHPINVELTDVVYSDADGDLDSDGEDFLIWQRQLGAGDIAQLPAGVVPEPRTLGLVALVLTAPRLFRLRPGRRIS